MLRNTVGLTGGGLLVVGLLDTGDVGGGTMRVVDDADVRGRAELLAAELLGRPELLELAELLACGEVEFAAVDPIGPITVLVAPLDSVWACVVLSEGSAAPVRGAPP